MVQRRMFRTIRSKETSQIAIVTEFKTREYLKDKINELATHSKNKNVHNLYSWPHIIRMRWAGHGACIRRRGNAYRVLVGKPDGKG
jgi:hypothetical protein